MNDFNRYKKEILTVDKFYEERPDLAVHTEQSIQSAINSASSMLNSYCNNLISEVWNYNNPIPDSNMIDDAMNVPDPSNPLYRTQYELNLILEAFIQQTQYTINLGNEFTTGSSSGSIGNINFSTARHETQDVLAPAVLTLLAKARVYKLNEFLDMDDKKNCDNGFFDEIPNSVKQCVTFEAGDLRYVNKYQPSINKKNMLLTVNPESKMTYWMDAIELDTNIPDDLVETVFQTTQRLNILEIDNEANKDLINNNTDDIVKINQKIADTGNVLENLVNANNENQVMIQTLDKNIENNSNLIKNIENEQNNQDKEIVENRAQIDSLKANVEQNTQDNLENKERISNLNQNVNEINQFFKDGNIIRFRGQWNSTTNYAEFDYVLYNDKTYFAIKPSVDIEPGTNPDYWKEQSISQNINLENYYKKIDGINIDNGDTPTIELSDNTNHLTKISKYGILSVDDEIGSENFAITLNNKFVGVVNDDYVLGGELVKDCAFLAPWEDVLTQRMTPTLLFMPSNENPVRFTTLTNGRLAFNDVNVFKPRYGVIEGLAHFEELVQNTDYVGEAGRLAVNKKYVDEVKTNIDSDIANQAQEIDNVNRVLSQEIGSLRDEIYSLQQEINTLKNTTFSPTYYCRCWYSGANITFEFKNNMNQSITAGFAEVKWNFQNGYTDQGGSYDTKNNAYVSGSNVSSLRISYPARNNYYAAYEYILADIEVHYQGKQYYATLQNFWTPYNGRAQFDGGKIVCFNLVLLPGNK